MTDRIDFGMKHYITGMSRSLRNWFLLHRIHIFFWAVYILYESGLTGIFVGRFGKAENYIVHYLLNISLFYFHSRMMDTFAKVRFYILAVFCLIIVEITIYIPVLATLNHIFTEYNQSTPLSVLGIDKKFVGGAVYRSIFFIIVSTGYWFLRQYLKERKKAEELEWDRLQQILKKEIAERNFLIAKNAHLRAQVSPHLLFNTLTFIYRRVRRNDVLAGEAIISLTSLMRYSIEINYNSELVPLSEEVAQVRDLSKILKILKGDKFYFELNIEECVLEIKIIPLLLITLMENMYKHGDLSNPENYGKMNIFQKDDMICIQTKNIVSNETSTSSLKTGLNNLQARIFDYYGKNSGVTFGKFEGAFDVSIKIPV
ncbi:histidine kinase [Pedobacter alluvionis]|uniref:Histidine kinase n=2 Tax=Pedobacter alluvionis TaxID=475253 RepID=A0A497Y022_9SPHI|nr:histidine kinase [Pedobacter alluvionis]